MAGVLSGSYFRELKLGKLIGRRTWRVEYEGVAPDLNVPLDPLTVNAGRRAGRSPRCSTG